MSDEVACGIQYRRPGGPQPGDRIVRCQLDAGHEGDHEEVDTGSKWPSGIADLVGLDPNFTDGLSTDEYMRALRCGHYDECKAAEVERDRLAAELAQARADRERTVAVHTQAYKELSRAGAKRDESETQRAVQVAELGASNASLIRRVADLENQLAEAQRDAEQMRLILATHGQGIDPNGYYAGTPGWRLRQKRRDDLKATIHPALHELDVRITGLNEGSCHCGLVAEVVIDAILNMDAYDAAGKGETDDPSDVAASGRTFNEDGADVGATWEVRCGADFIFRGSEEDCDRWMANARHWDEQHGLPFERHGMHKVRADLAADSRAGQAGGEVAG